MADTSEQPTPNGNSSEMVDGNEHDSSSYTSTKQTTQNEITLFTLLNNLIAAVFFSQPATKYASVPLLRRIKASLSENVPLLREASHNTAHHVLLWTRRGSPIRALLIVSVGTVTLLTLTGLLVFMLFFVAATFNAVVMSLLMSLAAAGGFLAFFFACVTAIYISALSIAVLVISATTISAIIASLIITGWVGFFWVVWVAVQKSLSLAKRSLSMTGSALTAYSSARPGRPTKTKQPIGLSD